MILTHGIAAPQAISTLRAIGLRKGNLQTEHIFWLINVSHIESLAFVVLLIKFNTIFLKIHVMISLSNLIVQRRQACVYVEWVITLHGVTKWITLTHDANRKSSRRLGYHLALYISTCNLSHLLFRLLKHLTWNFRLRMTYHVANVWTICELF